jgi:hypothetical protein
MLTSETEVFRLAREMIKQHGAQAAVRAAERLNGRIDEGDWRGRDVWARVVHAVHEVQRADAGMPSAHEPWHSPEAYLEVSR